MPYAGIDRDYQLASVEDAFEVNDHGRLVRDVIAWVDNTSGYGHERARVRLRWKR